MEVFWGCCCEFVNSLAFDEFAEERGAALAQDAAFSVEVDRCDFAVFDDEVVVDFVVAAVVFCGGGVGRARDRL